MGCCNNGTACITAGAIMAVICAVFAGCFGLIYLAVLENVSNSISILH